MYAAYVCVCVCVCELVRVYMYVYMCVCVCVCVWVRVPVRVIAVITVLSTDIYQHAGYNRDITRRRVTGHIQKVYKFGSRRLVWSVTDWS